MVSLAEYKKALGKKANNLSEKEIERLFSLSERLSRALFDAWRKNLKIKSDLGNIGATAVK